LRERVRGGDGVEGEVVMMHSTSRRGRQQVERVAVDCMLWRLFWAEEIDERWGRLIQRIERS
jgi:hypothetical protein